MEKTPAKPVIADVKDIAFDLVSHKETKFGKVAMLSYEDLIFQFSNSWVKLDAEKNIYNLSIQEKEYYIWSNKANCGKKFSGKSVVNYFKTHGFKVIEKDTSWTL